MPALYSRVAASHRVEDAYLQLHCHKVVNLAGDPTCEHRSVPCPLEF